MLPARALPTAPELPRAHGRRLRDYYRSAGWPCLDTIEIDLLNAGLIERVTRPGGLDAIRVTDAGIQALGNCLQRNRRAFDPHEALVARVARHLAQSGRLTYRNLTLRGRVGEGWQVCRPDVYSIRFTTVEAYACPVIYEVKVRRADLLSDLKQETKRASYQALSSEFYYVMPAGLADCAEIPDGCGVLFATDEGFSLGRPAPVRTVSLSVAEWMVLARRGAEFIERGDEQGLLADAG